MQTSPILRILATTARAFARAAVPTATRHSARERVWALRKTWEAT